MGTPGFACPILDALIARPDPVVGVVCQPDRPRGRGLKLSPPEVKVLATERGVPVIQPERVRTPEFLDALRALAPDLIVVAAYGRILPQTILDLPPHGCINVHASLLPRFRGAAPINWAIMEGDAETGVAIMRMVEEMDAGDVLLERRTPIAATDTAGVLNERLAHLGAEAIGAAIDALKAGHAVATPQPKAGVTFAPRIERTHCRIDWTRPAAAIERQIRGLAPAPSAFTTLDGRPFKVHAAAVERGTSGTPGVVLRCDADAIVVATGDGALRLLDVQPEGKRRMPAAAFLAGHQVAIGLQLGATA